MAGAQPKLELHTFFNVSFSDLKRKTWIILRLGKHNYLTTRFCTHHPPTTVPSTWRSQCRYTVQPTKASDGPYILLTCLCAL